MLICILKAVPIFILHLAQNSSQNWCQKYFHKFYGKAVERGEHKYPIWIDRVHFHKFNYSYKKYSKMLKSIRHLDNDYAQLMIFFRFFEKFDVGGPSPKRLWVSYMGQLRSAELDNKREIVVGSVPAEIWNFRTCLNSWIIWQVPIHKIKKGEKLKIEIMVFICRENCRF